MSTLPLLCLTTALALAGAPAAAAQCPSDDSFAPNHQCQTAAQLAGKNGVLGDLRLLSLFNDHFEIQVSPGERITVDITEQSASVAVDLTLRAGSCGGAPIASSPTASGRQAVYVNGGTTFETVYIRVDRPTGGDNCVPYTLEWRRDGQHCPGADAFEPNDSCAQARDLGTAGITIYPDLTCGPSDDDWFSRTLQPGERLTAAISFPHSVADLDLQLVGACGSTLDSSASVTNDEQVEYTNTTGAPRDVQVRAYFFSAPGGTTCGEYDLTVTVEDTSDPCQDDGFEDNDSCGAGFLITNYGIVTDLVVKDGDDDHFTVVVDPGETIFTRIRFDHAEGDLDLWLIDQADCSTTLASSRSVTDDESVTWTNSGAAPRTIDVWVEHFTADGGCNDYEINFGFGDGLALQVCDGGVNSVGVRSRLGVVGTPFASNNDILLVVNELPAGTFGIFFNSPAMGVLFPPGASGPICINSGGIGRFQRPGEIVQASSQGSVELQIDLTDLPRPGGSISVAPGDIWFFQYWHRDLDLNGLPTSNFSSAAAVAFQ